MFKKNLELMLIELNKHHRSRDEIMFQAIQDRLEKSLLTYKTEIEKDEKYLMYKNNDRVIKFL